MKQAETSVAIETSAPAGKTGNKRAASKTASEWAHGQPLFSIRVALGAPVSSVIREAATLIRSAESCASYGAMFNLDEYERTGGIHPGDYSAAAATLCGIACDLLDAASLRIPESLRIAEARSEAGE